MKDARDILFHNIMGSFDSLLEAQCMPYIRGCIQSFRTVRLERELQMVQLSATRCSYIAIL